MYENMSFINAFNHLIICGINGCSMCRTTEQWEKVLPLSVYNNYLSTIKQQNTTMKVVNIT